MNCITTAFILSLSVDDVCSSDYCGEYETCHSRSSGGGCVCGSGGSRTCNYMRAIYKS